MPDTKENIISQLRKDIFLAEGFKSCAKAMRITGLEAVEAAFPNGIFPTGAVHEFLNAEPEHTAASAGFIAGILAALTRQGGICLWIGASKKFFAPALKTFGVAPDKIIFVESKREKDVLWIMEEGLKYEGLAAVIAEVRELTFMQSRRLQLAVEHSKVTGFVLRTDTRKVGATASVARWQITPLPSELEDGMPGVGFPRWQVELLKIRNGKPGSWQMEWAAGRFIQVIERAAHIKLMEKIRKVG